MIRQIRYFTLLFKQWFFLLQMPTPFTLKALELGLKTCVLIRISNTILQVLKAIIKKFSRSLETLRATKTKQRQALLFYCVCSRSLFCLLKEMWITDCYCCSTFFFFFGWGVDYLQIDIIAVYHTKASSPRSKLCGTAQGLNRYYRSSLL